MPGRGSPRSGSGPGEVIAGLRDSGCFTRGALLEAIAQRRHDRAPGERALAARGEEFFAALGFVAEETAGPTRLLTANGARVAVAVVLARDERVDVGARRFGGVSPALHGLARADAERVEFVVVLGAGAVRLYPAAPGFGVARRGRTDTFLEFDRERLADAGPLAALCSAEGLQRDGAVFAARDASRREAAAIALRLRAQIHERVLPRLARTIAGARELDAPTTEQLEEIHAASLSALFEAMFSALARGRGAADASQEAEALADVEWRALAPDVPGAIHEGLLASRLAIAAVDLAERRGRAGRVRSTMPARPGDRVAVAAGEPYLDTTSGERKFLGSYYTGRLVIDHLLDHGLERALAEHVERLAALDEDEAGRRFFEFHVADLAMGAGHFLVPALDRTERALAGALVARPLPGVLRALERLRSAARRGLGAEGSRAELDDGRLLRRMIAERCVHGVDRNPGAVALARRALQLHAFVPGLPPAAVERELVVGDSLVGIGTLAEALAEVDASAREELLASLQDMLARAREVPEAARPASALFDLLTASRLTPGLAGTLAEAVQLFQAAPARLCGGAAHERALAALAPLRPLHLPLAFPAVFGRARAGFDAIVGNPPWEEATLERDDFWSRWSPGLQGLPQHLREASIRALEVEQPARAEHYRQEVERSAALRRVLTCGDYPGMGTGDPDTYKAFAWRLWRLLARDGGRLALVLPRSALSAKGSAAWRAELLARGELADITLLVNRGGWVFEDVHPQYTVALVSAARGRAAAEVPLRGPFADESAYRAGMTGASAAIPLSDLAAASEELAFPSLPTPESIDLWSTIRRAPRLDRDRPGEWRARAVSELHATQEKREPGRAGGPPVALMHFVERRPDGYWPVYKGESFDIWRPDRGRCYAWAEPACVTAYLQAKRLRAHRGSPLAEMGAAWRARPETLPCLRPRIAFRDVTRATDSRTVRAALVPAEVVLTNTAPYLLWPRGDERDEAFLLGVLCSLPLDWYARRYVETHLNFHLFNALPIPRREADDPLRARVVALAGRLAAQDRRLEGWAQKVGVACGRLDGAEEDELAAELDAVVARLYGLSRRQLVHVFETFHRGWEHARRLDATLRYFDRRG